MGHLCARVGKGCHAMPSWRMAVPVPSADAPLRWSAYLPMIRLASIWFAETIDSKGCGGYRWSASTTVLALYVT